MILKQKRINKGLTVNELADDIGLSISSLTRYENLHRFPNKGALKKIKEYYNLNNETLSQMFFEYFFKGEN